MEGIALDGKGGFWIAQEGRTDRVPPHARYNVNAKGETKKKIGLPAELMAEEIRFGFEGVTRIGDALWMAVARAWNDHPKGCVKLVASNTGTSDRGAVRYLLKPKGAGSIGLSEIVAHGDRVCATECDNQIGSNAKVTKVFGLPASEAGAARLGADLPVVSKHKVRDLTPWLAANGGYIVGKVEELAILADGTAWISTGNDGVDDGSGKRLFGTIGRLG